MSAEKTAWMRERAQTGIQVMDLSLPAPQSPLGAGTLRPGFLSPAPVRFQMGWMLLTLGERRRVTG